MMLMESVFLYISFALLLLLLWLTVYQIFCIDDLEHDLINPYDLADRINALIIKEFLLQGVLSAFFLLTSHWFLFFVSAPVTFYHLKLHKEQNHLIDITGVFSVLKSEKQFRMIKVGFYAVPFLTVALRLVFSTARSFVDENVTLLDLH